MRIVTVGIMGAGRIGKMHAENLAKMENVRIKAIADPYVDVDVENWAKSIGIQNIIRNVEDLFEDNDIEALIICSPTNTHPQMILRAAENGKHVFCEKPIAYDLDAAKKAVQATEKHKVKLEIGFNRRFDPRFALLHKKVLDGQTGQLNYIKITTRDSVWPNVDYLKISGGVYFDMMIHDFDIARYVTNSEITEVYARGAVRIEPKINEFNDVDTSIVSLEFADGSLGLIDLCRYSGYGFDSRVEVYGRDNTFYSNDCADKNTLYANDMLGLYKLKTEFASFIERFKESYFIQVKGFIDTLLKDRDVAVSGKDGLQAMIIAKAAQESLKQNKPVKINSI